MKQLSPFAIVLLVAATTYAADWPTYRADAQRSGYTAEQLPPTLSLAWKYQPLHGPSPAWPRDDRMMFDRAFDVTVSGSLAFFGNSEDGRVVALDTATGRECWSFFTDAPVRFAPKAATGTPRSTPVLLLWHSVQPHLLVRASAFSRRVG